MTDNEALAQRFEDNRAYLQSVAYRMLGSATDADDAVQEAWLRLSRSDAGEVQNLRAWLTTVVARICLDMLRSRKSRREGPLPQGPDEPVAGRFSEIDPEHEALMADSIGIALLVVLETLTPAERVAFVLHDMFDVPFDEIGPIVGRSPDAARQLASRARRRVRGNDAPPGADRSRQREIVAAFLRAARDGDLTALLALLDPDVVVRADAAALALNAARRAAGDPELAPEIRGADAVARTFRGAVRAAEAALVNGAPALVFAPGGRTRAVIGFTIDQEKIVEIRITADRGLISRFDIEITG